MLTKSCRRSLVLFTFNDCMAAHVIIMAAHM
jgi:hypothetical protein